MTPSVAACSALVASLLLSGGVAGCLGGDSPGDRGRPPRDEFVDLRERPLDLPSAPAGEFGGGCVRVMNVGAIGLPGVPAEAALGPWPGETALRRGPVYVALQGAAPRIASRRTSYTIWVSRSSYRGPVLVRAGRLNRGSTAGAFAFGTQSGSKDQLRLPARRWSPRDLPRADQPLPDGWRATPIPVRIREPGCYAFQVDGRSFSYVLTFGVQ